MNVYTFDNQNVVILACSDVPGLRPLETFGDLGIYLVEDAPEEEGLLTLDDSYTGYCGKQEIVCDKCVNPEDDQKLLYGFWTKDYATANLVTRELCIRTTYYHEWTSVRSIMENIISVASKEGEICANYASELRKAWEHTISTYPETPFPYGCRIPTFDDLLEACGVVVADK